LLKPAYIHLKDAWRIVRERLENSGVQRDEAGNVAEFQLRDAMFKGEIKTLADLIRGRPGWNPFAEGDTSAPLVLPDRRPVPPALWNLDSAEVRLLKGSVVFRTKKEVLLYKSVRVCRADVEPIWPPASAPTPDEPKSEGVPRAIIYAAVQAAYDNADPTRPPNIKQLPAAVRPLLEQQGYCPSGREIENVGKEFKHRRRKPGRTIASELRARQR
jgi:hypothetical protein